RLCIDYIYLVCQVKDEGLIPALSVAPTYFYGYKAPAGRKMSEQGLEGTVKLHYHSLHSETYQYD
ncbi:MAG: hypothetical protein ACYS3S_23340, partial [Planctomycetota bacterium]